jgi:hypothetical protein
LPLTGAAAIAEMKRQKQIPHVSRQTSPNPQAQALQSLLGTEGMSKPTDAPAPEKMSEPLRKPAQRIAVIDQDHGHTRGEPEQNVSPVSLGGFGVEGSGGGNAMTATANHNHTSHSHFVAEPAQMSDEAAYPNGNSNGNGNLAVQPQDGDKNMSLSYPGPPPQPSLQSAEQDQEHGPSRSMTLPGSGYNPGSPKSPASNKRHKCPYCSTDFTRHHNLKSHLLTHSQEKPYVCQTCQARFRRLHDLKRHTKLHTGERPHTCDKCGRKFARGDALARHNKGPGGCAGRRSSFGGDEDGMGDGMEGVEYQDDEDAIHDEQHAHRLSEPRKRQQLETPQDPNRQVYRQHSSTYPPTPRQMQGSMGPPQVIQPGSSSATSPRDMSGQAPSPASGGGSLNTTYYGSGQVFAEPGMMTHSPKPLSPGQTPHDHHRLSVNNNNNNSDNATAQLAGRNRSTSLSTQLQQAHFGRGSGTRTPPQQVSVPFAPSQQQQQQQPPPPHNNNILPPLTSTTQQPSSRGTPQSTTLPAPTHPIMSSHHHSHSHGHVPTPSSYPPPAVAGSTPSNPSSSLSNHGGRSSGGGGGGSTMLRDLAAAGQDPAEIWQYIRQLEQKFGRMQDEYELRISRLQEEVISLKGQVGHLSSSSNGSGSGSGNVNGGASYSSSGGGGPSY